MTQSTPWSETSLSDKEMFGRAVYRDRPYNPHQITSTTHTTHTGQPGSEARKYKWLDSVAQCSSVVFHTPVCTSPTAASKVSGKCASLERRSSFMLQPAPPFYSFENVQVYGSSCILDTVHAAESLLVHMGSRGKASLCVCLSFCLPVCFSARKSKCLKEVESYLIMCS